MTNENPLQSALKKMRDKLATGRNMGIDEFTACADVEARVEQTRQQELGNMIAMLSNPAACPYPSAVVLARIKELTNLG